MGKNTIVKDTLILLAITLISGLLLGLVYDITKTPIANAEEKAKQEAYAAVYPNFEKGEDLTDKLADFKADDSDAVITEALATADGEGYVFSCNAKGYGGAVNLALGVKNDGTITGLTVLSMSETPGLGAKCTSADFLKQFEGIQSEKLTINQDFQQISGATITSSAVMRAVNATLKFVAENAQ